MTKRNRPQRIQFSLFSTFLCMTVVSLITAGALFLLRTEQSETTLFVLSVFLLFIPLVIVLFVLSAAILISIIGLLHFVYRLTIRLGENATA